MAWKDTYTWLTFGESPLALSAYALGVLAASFRLGVTFERVTRKDIAELRKQLAALEAECASLRGRLASAEAELSECRQKLKTYQSIRDALFGEEGELWHLRPVAPPAGYLERLVRSRPRIVTIGHLKGGVGKTTLTANLAAYFEKKRGLRVLVIDMDYQGSLSMSMLRAAGLDYEESLIDVILTGQSSGADLVRIAKSLNPALPQTSLITASYDLARLENRLMLGWLLHETEDDIRFNLGKALLDPVVQSRYDVILIDAPPRLSAGAINAYSASHFYIVPTVPDRLSSEAVGRFLKNLTELTPQLNPALALAGVVVNLSQSRILNARELDVLGVVKDALAMLHSNSQIFTTNIPRLSALSDAAGHDIAYLRNKLFRDEIMDPLGDEISRTIGLG